MVAKPKAMRAAPAPVSPPDLTSEIEGRLSQELIFAFMGPVASGVSKSAAIVGQVMADYNYEVMPVIKVSQIIAQEAHRVNMQPKAASDSMDNRIDYLQSVGNALREKYGPDYLAKKVIHQIAEHRGRVGFETIVEDAPPRPKADRRAYIIDSLKNEAELKLLRSVYKDILVVIGVFAPEHIRKHRLELNKIQKEDVNKIMDRDQGEIFAFGQQVRSIFSNSDFFIRNDRKNEKQLKIVIDRYVELIFGVGNHTPTLAEAAMHEATAASFKSACMSRQVGAAIVDSGGSIISVGWNDVPRADGGLYTEDDQFGSDDKDHRCFRFEQHQCHNDAEKAVITEKIIRQLRNSGVVVEGTTDSVIKFALNGSGIESLIEFSRAVHAEMEAILSVARDARHSIKGATLYTTTYPCHNCARHIVAAGIKKVVYIVPYKKSLAIQLHNDSITENEDDQTHVVFSQYDGVSPRHFVRLFQQNTPRKLDGRYHNIKKSEAKPLFTQRLDSFTVYEMRVMEEVLAIEVER